MAETPQPRSRSRARSTSRSRPTTPLRASSRSSFRESARGSSAEAFPLNAFEPAFGELADAMADLEANLHHFRIMHESLKRFGESFAAFLYGLEVNAFCVDFPEAPVRESWGMAKMREELEMTGQGRGQSRPGSSRGITLEDLGGATGRKAPGGAAEETFMTTDVSFVDNPSTASKPKFETPAPKRGTSSRPSRMPAPGGRGRATELAREDDESDDGMLPTHPCDKLYKPIRSIA
ncbi:hypothetical protein MKZ38_004351 [Zalerion maritima]|uniref:DASH complex subunit DAM1 n=1 Tax=Zalerion maritima TaxID=339359 RepID=A0AAD5RMT5_9PEZI|nr:hypothetical protein MKZ38_004351 [Zalerion maritima]